MRKSTTLPLILLLALRRRSKPQTRPTTGLEGLQGVIGKPLPNTLPGPGCSGLMFKARLEPLIAPEVFEGEWSCCLLGCGGWGCAYKCTRNEEPVVFKVPRGLEGILHGEPLTISEKLLEKARKEAEAIAGLRHPHILKLLAHSKTIPLLVYEYANGGSLARQLGQGWRPSLRDIILLGVQLGDALRYVHSRGLVHGDVKPGNVFIAGGVAKLGDFSGVTKLLSQASTHPTQAYTPGWRAPEQVYSDLRRKTIERGLENRVDVYQLGNLLLYLLTGEHIDGEEAVDTVAKAKVLSKVEDSGLRSLLEDMLRLDPQKRPSMDEVVRKLLQLL